MDLPPYGDRLPKDAGMAEMVVVAVRTDQFPAIVLQYPNYVPNVHKAIMNDRCNIVQGKACASLF